VAQSLGSLWDPRRAWPAWLLLPLGTWLVFRYRWVLDDAFIYFRYAENFAQTGELVFNVGEYVEGFTSPLWMLLLAAIRVMGLPFWPVVVGMSFACLVLFWLLLFLTNDALSPAGGSGVFLPGALLCTNYAVLSHFSSGMETPLVQVCGAAFAYLCVRPSSRLAQVMLASAPLVRPELVLPFIVGLAWSWWQRRRFPKLLGVVGGVLGAAWLVFRVQYYADLFPNTYYLKSASRWSRGVSYLLDTGTQYWFHAWLIALLAATGALVLWRPQQARLQERAVIWFGAGLVAIHVVRIGGDFVHYRYLAFPVCAVFASFGGVAESLLQGLPRARRSLGIGITLLAGALMFTMYPRRQLAAHPLALGRHDVPILDALTRSSRDGIEDAMRHRSIQQLAPQHWDVASGTRQVPPRYTDLVATGWCAAGYEQMDAYVLHTFGLTNAVLARLPVGETVQAGHKWNLRPYADSLAVLWTNQASMPAELRRPIRSYPERGSFREAVEAGRAPPWITNNLSALELIEDKTLDATASLRVALARPKLVL
jgi:hypothetical protein